MTVEMLAAAAKIGNDAIVGEKWHLYFIQRHKRISSVYSRKIDAARTNEANKGVIKEWFDRYDQIITEHKIPPANQWNMNESDLKIVDSGREKVLIELTNLTKKYLV